MPKGQRLEHIREHADPPGQEDLEALEARPVHIPRGVEVRTLGAGRLGQRAARLASYGNILLCKCPSNVLVDRPASHRHRGPARLQTDHGQLHPGVVRRAGPAQQTQHRSILALGKGDHERMQPLALCRGHRLQVKAAGR